MYRVGFIGNPNVGKTSIYNIVTRSKERVGNWPGVTVDSVSKKVKFDEVEIEFVDLPGLYSLNSFSKEEEIAVSNFEKKWDLIICVCSAVSLSKGLYLTTQVLQKVDNVILAINMSDELKKQGSQLDINELERRLGVKCVFSNTISKRGCFKLIDTIKSRLQVQDFDVKDTINKYRQILDEDRYTYVKSIVDVVYTTKEFRLSIVDKIVLNKYLALPIFLLVMASIFFITFSLVGNYSANYIDNVLTQNINNYFLYTLNVVHAPIWVISLVCDCLVVGVFGIIKFLPSIIVLYLLLTILEDSGYISRVAFVTDEIFCKIGLSGRSIFTLLLGFGCNTTALCTARNLENSAIQKKVILITPFVPCSARLPVFALIVAAIFDNNAWIIFALYLISVFVAIILASILQLIKVLRTDNPTVIMELPKYRLPRPKRLLQVMISNTKSFVVRVASIGITLNVIIWILSNFTASFVYVPSSQGISMLQMLGEIVSPIFEPLGFGNWRAIVALFGGVIAKEIILTTIAGMGGITVVLGTSRVVAFAYLLFILLYTPCISTMAEIAKEIGKKYLILSLALNNGLAYLIALLYVGLYNLWVIDKFVSYAVLALIIFLVVIIPRVINHRLNIKELHFNKSSNIQIS